MLRCRFIVSAMVAAAALFYVLLNDTKAPLQTLLAQPDSQVFVEGPRRWLRSKQGECSHVKHVKVVHTRLPSVGFRS